MPFDRAQDFDVPTIKHKVCAWPKSKPAEQFNLSSWFVPTSANFRMLIGNGQIGSFDVLYALNQELLKLGGTGFFYDEKDELTYWTAHGSYSDKSLAYYAQYTLSGKYIFTSKKSTTRRLRLFMIY